MELHQRVATTVTDLSGECRPLPAPTMSAMASPFKVMGKRYLSTLSTVRETPSRKQARTGKQHSSRQQKLADVRSDRLGEYVTAHTGMFMGLSWREFVQAVRGRGDLRVTEEARSSHPAGDLLLQFEKNGVPVVLSSAPWSQQLKDERSKRGSHKSCQDNMDFLREEILDYVEKGFWLLLPYRVLRHMKELRLSPLGIVPQRGRRPRLIVDYSFYGVNSDTLRLTPSEAMQFGRALERILYYIRKSNPRFGPVYLGKVDLADGFYRLRLTDSSILKLAVAFPQYPGEEQMVALPLSIPMGWVESPPAFCAATETVADLANHHRPEAAWPEHQLEEAACTRPEDEEDELDERNWTTVESRRIPPVITPFRKPVKFNDVYVDDFLLGFQGHSKQRRLHLRNILHTLDLVFRPLDADDRPTRKHVVSVKKLLKGDAFLSVTKVVLGWLINTVNQTIELPDHRKERAAEIFKSLKGKKQIQVRKWHKILGELRSMMLGIPGSRGLFSLLQLALQRVDEDGNILIDRPMRDQLDDFEHLTKDLASRPTAIAELVPDHPIAMGPHDASGTGMGGVWLPATTNSNITPLLWREEFPQDIVDELVSFDNPNGTINNSQLELTGQIAHQDILLQEYDCKYRTISPFGDNTNAVSWSHKGSATTLGPTAYLLRLNSLHQRHFRYLSKADYLPGVYNRMADELSRLWHLTDSQILLHFELHYPQPQPWRIVHLRSAMRSSLISALQMKRGDLQSVLNDPMHKTPIGPLGLSSVRPLGLTPTLKQNQSSYLFSKFLPCDYDKESSVAPTGLSGLGPWRTIYAPSLRRSPAWGPRTHA